MQYLFFLNACLIFDERNNFFRLTGLFPDF